MRSARLSSFAVLSGVGIVVFATGLSVAACGSRRDGFDPTNIDKNEPDNEGGTPPGFGNDAGDPDAMPPEGETRDPVTCEEAKATKSYVGCDYWPTVTPNAVWSIFDFAAVVANTGTTEATVTVTGPNAVNKSVKVPAGEVRKIYLPWVPELKGKDTDPCTTAVPLDQSVVATMSAYHLVSTTPVIVYQFNALEYKGQGGEGPDGGPKDWSTCPGSAIQCDPGFPYAPYFAGCFSFSNDASLLLPSTAMTGNYRVIAQHGWTETRPIQATALTITATEDETQLTVNLAPAARVVASTSGTVPATAGGGTITMTLAKAGDVLQLASEKGREFDFSGSLVKANKAVQVISSVPCINLPQGKAACDHIEESVLPAETLGKRYVVNKPTGPSGQAVRHNVRLYGNRDGTVLTYEPAKPPKCPNTLAAGQVVDCDLVDNSFEVTGDKEFAVATFLLASQEVDPVTGRGDPDESTYASVEQYRTKYVFLAPDDYPDNYVDITGPEDAEVELDGKALTAKWEAVGASSLGVYRVKLGPGKGGAHSLVSKKPVGVQVLGYGSSTSYQYPAGLNLKIIAPPPPPK